MVTLSTLQKKLADITKKKKLLSPTLLNTQPIDVVQKRTVKAQHCLNDSVKNSESIIFIKSWPIAHSFFHSTITKD